jgi:hypothetical protein
MSEFRAMTVPEKALLHHLVKTLGGWSVDICCVENGIPISAFETAFSVGKNRSIRLSELIAVVDAAQWSTVLSLAPHACHVMAARFEDGGEWITGVVMSPPSRPWTHWRHLPDMPSR